MSWVPGIMSWSLLCYGMGSLWLGMTEIPTWGLSRPRQESFFLGFLNVHLGSGLSLSRVSGMAQSVPPNHDVKSGMAEPRVPGS